MAPEPKTLTTKVQSGSPYQLDKAQTLKASSALLKHIKSDEQRKETENGAKNLLAKGDSSDDEEVDDSEDTLIWLVLTTKKHIVDKKRLKPGKIPIPHPLNTSPTSTICLITADPQRTYKDLIADPSFPSSLASRITRVLGASKLRSKYKSYESRRQLFNDYDLFLADDRIVTLLPNLLGKIFYKGGSKRPIPVNITGDHASNKKSKDQKQEKPSVEVQSKSAPSPTKLAHEINRALSSALVHLSPSATTSVKVGKASWAPENVAANIEAVVEGLVTKYVPKGWRNVRSVHVKGPETMALPIWLASELWVDEAEDVLEELPKKEEIEGGVSLKQIEGAPKKEKSKKRKAKDAEVEAQGEGDAEVVTEQKKSKKAKKDAKPDGAADLALEIATRKEKLKKQKAEALKAADIADDLVDGADKKAKKEKKVKTKKSKIAA